MALDDDATQLQTAALLKKIMMKEVKSGFSFHLASFSQRKPWNETTPLLLYGTNLSLARRCHQNRNVAASLVDVIKNDSTSNHDLAQTEYDLLDMTLHYH